MYTLKNQQIYWDSKYFLLNQGIPTGGKHSVPIANIFLSFVLLSSLQNNEVFKQSCINDMELWKRFIDDCFGVLRGSIDQFLDFFQKLKGAFLNYGLELTCDTDSHTVADDSSVIEKEVKCITFLDMDKLCRGLKIAMFIIRL